MNKRRKRCSECKKLFMPRLKKQVTCGDDECKKLRQNRLRRVGVERDYFCEICGEATWSNMPHAKLCQKEECRHEYKRRFNLKKFKSGFDYKKIHTYNKKKNDSTKYSHEDLVKLWYMKLKGCAFKDIAKKLKRNIEPLSQKHRTMRKYPARYIAVIAEAEEKYESEKPRRYKDISFWNKEIKQCFK